MNLIEVSNLSYSVSNQTILNDVSFTLKKGEYLNIIGPNGSGKTTLVELITNLIKPTEGTIKINETNIGYLPQKLSLKKNFPITVKEVIKSGVLNTKLLSDENIMKWLKMMGIGELLNEKMHVLSGGQQQRVFIIRTLINEPSILILDEPTSALDPDFREGFNIFLKSLCEKKQITIINVTHDLSELNLKNTKVLYIDKEIKYYGDSINFKELEHGGVSHVWVF